MLDYHRKYRNKSTGKISSKVYNALDGLDVLTIDRDFLGIPHRKFHTHKTLFKELELVPYQPQMVTPAEGVTTVDTLAEAIEDVVLRLWDPSAFHVVLHSSGYDSRMISGVLTHIRDSHPNGMDFTGDVLFVCTKWEGSSFKRIMQFEGWSPDQYVVYRESADRTKYYMPCFEKHSRAWQWANGYSWMGVNLFWYPIEELIGSGHIPRDRTLQCWNSQWSNTGIDTLPLGLGQFHHLWRTTYYHPVLAHRIYYEPVVLPFIDDRLLSVIAALPSDAIGHHIMGQSRSRSIELRSKVIESFVPGLSKFDNMAASGDRREPVHMELRRLTSKQLRRTWLGRRMNIEPARSTEFSKFWQLWTAGSFIDHLIDEGREIRW